MVSPDFLVPFTRRYPYPRHPVVMSLGQLGPLECPLFEVDRKEKGSQGVNTKDNPHGETFGRRTSGNVRCLQSRVPGFVPSLTETSSFGFCEGVRQVVFGPSGDLCDRNPVSNF